MIEPLLRHPGSHRPESGHKGNTMFMDRVYAGSSGLARSCGKCLTHKPSLGGWTHKVRGWCCAGCKPVKVAA